jgi:hypothetical protein
VSVLVGSPARFDAQYDDVAAESSGLIEGEGFADGGQDSKNACHPRPSAGVGDFYEAGDAHGYSPNVTATAAHPFEMRGSRKSGDRGPKGQHPRIASDDDRGEVVEALWIRASLQSARADSLAHSLCSRRNGILRS